MTVLLECIIKLSFIRAYYFFLWHTMEFCTETFLPITCDAFRYLLCYTPCITSNSWIFSFWTTYFLIWTLFGKLPVDQRGRIIGVLLEFGWKSLYQGVLASIVSIPLTICSFSQYAWPNLTKKTIIVYCIAHTLLGFIAVEISLDLNQFNSIIISKRYIAIL